MFEGIERLRCDHRAQYTYADIKTTTEQLLEKTNVGVFNLCPVHHCARGSVEIMLPRSPGVSYEHIFCVLEVATSNSHPINEAK